MTPRPARSKARELARRCCLALADHGFRAALAEPPGPARDAWGVGLALVIAARRGQILFIECTPRRPHPRRSLVGFRRQVAGAGIAYFAVHSTRELELQLDRRGLIAG